MTTLPPLPADLEVIFVDDDPDLLRATTQTLELHNIAVHAHASAAAALRDLSPAFPGVLITDLRMPGMDGHQLFERVRAIDTDIPVILVSGHLDIPVAVQAMRDGAYDVINKPYPSELLVAAISRACEKRRLILANRKLRRALEEDTVNEMALIGNTPVMERIRNTIRHIADADVNVLIEGETGTGKEVVATLLHQFSRRKQRALVAINCGALPESVIESELFGHEPGAFTGAQKKRIGRIEHASGGTLFLDEIESMPLAMQVKLLRVLETRQVTPLGTNDIRPVDLRVVAATKVDLGDPARRESFREDLYYRLNVVTIHLPPLRERRDDILMLFAHHARRAAERFQRDVPALTATVRQHLTDHPWPGNIRELSHFAERFVLGVLPDNVGVKTSPVAMAPLSLPERMEQHEARLIREALERHKGDVKATLQDLGLPRKTFYDKLQRHNIDRQAYIGQ